MTPKMCIELGFDETEYRLQEVIMPEHDHTTGDHSHSHGNGNERAVGIAAILTGGFMLIEVLGGIISGSLALIADAGHMLTDSASLFLAWLAFRLARRPASWNRTYGFDRFSVLAAFVNGLTLFAIAAWISFEAYQRLNQPVEIMGGLMFWVALAGLAVNILAFWILSRGEKNNLNIRAALLHVMGDLLGSVGALVAAVVIIYTGWTPIDPILSVFVALIILKAAWNVVRESGHILLQGTPRGFETEAVAKTIMSKVSGVTNISHIHAWSLTQERPMVTLEAEIEAGTDPQTAKQGIKSVLQESFGVSHVTVEIDVKPT
jgi:cobalt-zinc-cadmium efflux system protein